MSPWQNFFLLIIALWPLSCREPTYGFTPLMEAAAAGHEIIVQYFLNYVSDPVY